MNYLNENSIFLSVTAAHQNIPYIALLGCEIGRQLNNPHTIFNYFIVIFNPKGAIYMRFFFSSSDFLQSLCQKRFMCVKLALKQPATSS